MRLLLDEHLSPAIAVTLRSRGHDVVAVAERADLRTLSDPMVFAAAVQERRAVVTLDFRGFRALARQALVQGSPSFGLVLVPRGRSSWRVAIVDALDRLLRELPGDDDLVVRRGGEVWLGPLARGAAYAIAGVSGSRSRAACMSASENSGSSSFPAR
jgi:predicted nuclease of predicted toxin-antitoxin system